MPQLSLYAKVKRGLIKVDKKSEPELRFWKHVDKKGPLCPGYGRCWLWTISIKGSPYGKIQVNGIREHVHRYSWMLHKGAISDGLWVLHRCDNPACVNPAHLFLGTHNDNMADMAKKWRSGRSLLTLSQVKEIRRRFRRGRGRGRYGSNCGILAKEFGVSGTAIRSVAEGRAYRHVT